MSVHEYARRHAMTDVKKTKRVYRCAICSRELRDEHWVYSSHTGSRYCWPGEGCARPEPNEKEG